jgi:YbbR domain-containing protein
MMEKIFGHNGWLKLLSVGLALLFWAMVMPSYTADTTKSFEIPLQVLPNQAYQNPDAHLPDTVQVQVSGRNLIVSKIKKESLKALVDLGRVAEAGRSTQLQIQVEGPFTDQVAYSSNPKTVLVTLYETKTAAIPVAVEPNFGLVTVTGKEYRVTAKPDPETLSVTGRGDWVSQIKRGLVTFDLGALEPSQTELTRPIVLVDAAGKPVENVVGSPVKVQLTWQELPPGHPFQVKASTKGTLPAGFVVSSIELLPSTVTVRSKTLGAKLPEREIIETTPIDLTGQRTPFNTTVRLIPPPGTEASVETVNAKVIVTELTVEKIFGGLPLTFTGKANNAEVSASVQEVQVSVKGPYSIMTPLNAGDLAPYVSLEGLQQGKHIIPVQVQPPAGVTQVLVDPAVVEVQITIR